MWSSSCFSSLLLPTLRENCDIPDVTSGHLRVPSRLIPGAYWESQSQWLLRDCLSRHCKEQIHICVKRLQRKRATFEICFWTHPTHLQAHEVKQACPMSAQGTKLSPPIDCLIFYFLSFCRGSNSTVPHSLWVENIRTRDGSRNFSEWGFFKQFDVKWAQGKGRNEKTHGGEIDLLMKNGKTVRNDSWSHLSVSLAFSAQENCVNRLIRVGGSQAQGPSVLMDLEESSKNTPKPNRTRNTDRNTSKPRVPAASQQLLFWESWGIF